MQDTAIDLRDADIQRLIRAITALYVSFIVVGGALIALVSVAVNRGIAAPLGELARAAHGR